MPRHCSVKGCRSNYKNEPKYITTFALPKDEFLRKQWIRKIPTDFSGLKNPFVCLKHFAESDIIRKDVCTVAGERREYPRKIPKLKENAVPSIFENLPKYLSTVPGTSKRLYQVEEEHMEQAVKDSIQSHKDYEQAKKIHTISDILTYYYNSNYVTKDWVLINQNEKVYLCYVDLCEDVPNIICSIVIQENLEYVLHVKGGKVSLKKFRRICKC